MPHSVQWLEDGFVEREMLPTITDAQAFAASKAEEQPGTLVEIFNPFGEQVQEYYG